LSSPHHITLPILVIHSEPPNVCIVTQYYRSPPPPWNAMELCAEEVVARTDMEA
jgi:hypothetical protein